MRHLRLALLAAGVSRVSAGQELPAIELTSWRTTDDVIDGWDWSLPPGIQPVPYSGVKYYDRAGRTLPGNRIVSVSSSWRELEPEEGQFDFQPLRQKLLNLPDDCAGAELHVYASVYETRYLDSGKVTPGTAPLWLIDSYDIPIIEEQAKTNLATPFQVVNLDIWDDRYHRRYLRFVEAFGKSGIAQMPQIMLSYVHGRSSSRGEEAGGRYEGRALQCMKERMAAWAQAFKGVEHKLAWVGNSGEILDYAYELGMGQRNGFVEMVLLHADNGQLGQYLDDDGYLCVDESCPPIAEGRAFGDENEEYARNVHVPRFGPLETWPHRYRESMLRALQMRRNFIWSEGNPWVDPPLLAYVSLELGRTVTDAPDIWCRLRESIIRRRGQPQPVRNFERWLYQRDRDGYRAAPTARADVWHTQLQYHPDHYYDYTARATDRANGSMAMGFAVDDRFLSGGPHQVAVKITYYDQGERAWALVYRTPQGEAWRRVECADSGAVKTATFFLGDAVFPATGLDFDFEIRADDVDAAVAFVRVIRLSRT
jgi:hypothetical protein